MAGPVGIGAFLEIAAGAASAYPKVQKVLTGLQATNDVLSNVSKNARIAKRQIMDMLDTVGGRWVKMNDIAFKTARTMAMSREQAIRYNQQLIQSTKELATQYGISAKELANFQKSYSEAIGRNVVLTREQLAHMSALSKITDEATAAQLVDEFDRIGIGVKSTLAHVGHMQEKAKAFGVNATAASKNLASNIKLASTYSFKNGLADIEKMTLESTALRANMESIMRSSEKFTTIEGAIETSAKLQMLGGNIGMFGANPMGTMYNAMADPAQYQKDLVKMAKSLVTYDSKTGETKMNPLQAQFSKATAEALGMSQKEFMDIAFAERKNQAVMQQMGSKAEGFTEEQKAAIQNLARGNFNAETGKYQISWLENGKEKTKNVEDITTEELEIARDSQATEENMMMDVKDIKTILERVHGRARETKSFAETTEGMSSWWDAQITNIQDTYMPFFSGLYNNFSNWLGKQYANGGIVEPIHAETGTIVPGTSYTGDKVPAMVNSGEMILNKNQQKSMFGLLSSLAVTGGAAYGVNKLGGKIGYGSLGSTMFLANMLGGGKTDLKSMIEAHFIMKAVKKLNPLKTSISQIGNASEKAAKTTGTFGTKLSDLGKKWGNITSDIGKNIQKSIKTYFTTGKWGKVTSFAGKVGSKTTSVARAVGSTSAKWAKGLGKFIAKPFISVANILKNTPLAKNLKEFSDTVKTSSFNRKANRFTTAKGQFKSVGDVGGKFTQKIVKAKGYGQELSRDIKGLFKSTGVATNETSSVAKAAGKGGKLLSGLGKVGKSLGKKIPYIGAALAVGSAVSGMMDASSQYDAKIDEIEKSGMSDRDKARAKDRATKEKNANMGGSIGSAAGGFGGMAAGAAAGAAIGSVVPVIGTAIGGLIGGALGAWGGEALGGTLGKGVGSLFGGNEEEKFLEEQKESAKAIAGNNEEIIKVLKSIDGKMPGSIQAGSNFGLKATELDTTVIRGLTDVGKHVAIKAVDTASNIFNAATGLDRQKFDINVSGTIKLEGNGKSVDLDIDKLIENPEFVRKLADVINSRTNVSVNGGKKKAENARNQTAKIFN